MKMILRFIYLLASIKFCLGYIIGRNYVNTVKVQQNNIDDGISALDVRNSVSRNGKKRQVLSVNSQSKRQQKDFDISLVSRLKAITDEREFITVLKAAAHKRNVLSSHDKDLLMDCLHFRVPYMSGSSSSDILWALGTLKLHSRNKVHMYTCLYLHCILIS